MGRQEAFGPSPIGWAPGVVAGGLPPSRGQQPLRYGTLSVDATKAKPGVVFKLPARGNRMQPVEVVAIHDYEAQRADELTFKQGDKINVLLKDSENWWLGELASGQQGFFPAYYVEPLSDRDAADKSAIGFRDEVTGAEPATKLHVVRNRRGEVAFFE